MKNKRYRIEKSHITKDHQEFFVIEVKTDLGWDEISKPMPLDRAEVALNQLTNPNAPVVEFAPIVEPDVVSQQSAISGVNAPSEVIR